MDSLIDAGVTVTVLCMQTLICVYAATFVFGKEATFRWLATGGRSIDRLVSSALRRLRKACVAACSDVYDDVETRLLQLEDRVFDLQAEQRELGDCVRADSIVCERAYWAGEDVVDVAQIPEVVER